MRFTVSSSTLNSKLGILSKVITSKNSIAILDSFLFEVSDNQLTLTASDNTNMMRFTIDLIESDGACSFCVSHRIMLQAVKELADQPLTFEIDTNTNSIRMLYQSGHYNIVGQAADEYPIPAALQGQYVETRINESVLAENIQRSIFATANDELRMVMNGIYFDMTEECLNIVASDGRKMVRNKILSCKDENPSSFILPKKPAALLRSVLPPDSENDVTLRFNEGNAEITFSEGFIACRLIDKRYPRYNAVIPRDNPNIITVDRKALCSALRRVLPFASESTQLTKLRMSMGNIELHSEDIDFATSAQEDIACDYNGVPMSIGFNGATLFELLSNLESEDVTIALGDPSRAGVIRPVEQPEGQDVLMIIMPMILNE